MAFLEERMLRVLLTVCNALISGTPAVIIEPSWWYSSARRLSWPGVKIIQRKIKMKNAKRKRNPAPAFLLLTLCDAIESGFEVAFGARAAHLADHLAVFKKEQGGNRADVELSGELLLVVRIDFANFDFAVVFSGKLVQQRGDHFAWAAPFGPKIHEDGFG